MIITRPGRCHREHPALDDYNKNTICDFPPGERTGTGAQWAQLRKCHCASAGWSRRNAVAIVPSVLIFVLSNGASNFVRTFGSAVSRWGNELSRLDAACLLLGGQTPAEEHFKLRSSRLWHEQTNKTSSQ